MTLERHYFISEDLDDLELVESELIDKGIAVPQIHVLSRDNANVQRHDTLNAVSSFMKRDMVRSGLIGVAVGAVLASLVLLIALLAGWTSEPAGAISFLFFAIALVGASAWIGGLWGIQKPNHQFRKFQLILDQGKHVFFVDLAPEHRGALDDVCAAHKTLEAAGTGDAAPDWAVEFSKRTQNLWYWRMWKNA